MTQFDSSISVRHLTRSCAGAARLALRRPHNWMQLIKFCLVGASGYIVNVGIYAALVAGFDVHFLAAAACSFLVAVTNNYCWNRVWTFRSNRGLVGIQGLRFLLVSTGGLSINLTLLAALVAGGLPKIPGQAVAIVLVTPLTFVANKLWTFPAMKVYGRLGGLARR